MGKLEPIRLINSNHAVLEILNFGATVMSLKVPDKLDNLVNVVLGLPSPNDYIDENFIKKGLFLGSTVGRYAGRISDGGYSIENKRYILHNLNGIHLHGGKEGFDKKYWNIDQVENGKNPFVVLSYFSEHMEEGYPGNLQVKVKYQLSENNTFSIEYKATTDKATHINLTNHSYFNLNGEKSILDHELFINSTHYLDVNEQLVPSGTLKSTNSSTFDFSRPLLLDSNFNGLDDTFVLRNEMLKATLYSKHTGITMNVATDQPAMVVFTPKMIEGLKFKDGKKYLAFPAICFEAQKYPDTPNNNHFPSTLLTPENQYVNKTSFVFGTK